MMKITSKNVLTGEVTVIEEYTPPHNTPSDNIPDLLVTLADLRWQRQSGGLTLPDGTRIATDAESRASIAGAVTGLSMGILTAPIAWKAETGWIDLTAEQVMTIAAAVAQHVQRCFEAERAVALALVADPTLDVAAAFDAEMIF